MCENDSIEKWITNKAEDEIKSAPENDSLFLQGSGVPREAGHFKDQNGKLYFIGSEK